MARGYVYVLVNRAMPGLVKIGISSKLPSERASELSTTGVPHPFEVRYYCEAEDPSACEGEIHRALDPHRVSNDREFFRVSVDSAVAAIRNLVQPLAEWERETGHSAHGRSPRSAPYDLSPESVGSNPAYLAQASKYYGSAVLPARTDVSEQRWRIHNDAALGSIASLICPYCSTEVTAPLSRESGLVPPKVVTCNRCRRTIIT